MELTPLTAVSPIDGRYRRHVQHLDEYFSEYALIKYRVFVEIEYFLFLADKKFFKLSNKASKHLRKLQEDFGLEDAQEIKQIEYTTNHDVKAVEYFLKNELKKCGADEAKEWIHFGLTSQDVNNTSIPLLWKHAIEYEYLPSLLNLNSQLKLPPDHCRAGDDELRRRRYPNARSHAWPTSQPDETGKRNDGIRGENRKPN